MPPELVLPIVLTASVAGLCLVLSWIFQEFSWVDRIWSIVPPVYVATFAANADWSDARLNLMTALTTLWGLRLTLNYARKGGYAPGGEDYRWRVLRSRMPRWAWELFNVGFISGYQNFLLLLLAMPAWLAWQNRSPLGVLDAVATVGFIALLIGETVADQQQWAFQQDRKARKLRGEPDGKGFLDTGLWAWSRHPNFFCEQGQWWMVYLFAVAAAGTPLNISILGAGLLTMLFDGSTRFTESITASKYPLYKTYQNTVSRMIPWMRRA